MRTKQITLFSFTVWVLIFFGCHSSNQETTEKKTIDSTSVNISEIKNKLNEYALVQLTTDISFLSEKEKQMLPLLMDIARIMDEIFWIENYGDKDELLSSVVNKEVRDFVCLNYGPWEQLNDNKPFISIFGKKPMGANFYPKDMKKEEFDALSGDEKISTYTIIRRKKDSTLYVIPYHVYFSEKIEKAATLMKKASALAEDPGLKRYLELRAEALLNDDYFSSDTAWMSMKNNNIDFVVGPIETYTDALFGYKAAHEACLLIKDKEWSLKLAKFSALLSDLQKSLPVENKYKTQMPGSDSDIGVYDVIYYAGDCNAGGKSIAINLPNDERVKNSKGSRKLQLKNSIRAKFDKILIPISNIMISEDQSQYIFFDAFFENIMFHEVAHGLGIEYTIDGKGTVRDALKEQYTALEEAKADIMGLYIIGKLYDKKELTGGNLMNNYVTFLASIFRSIRFGSADAHGKANMLTFNFFKENNAFTRDDMGTYRVNFENMKKAVEALSHQILIIQGDGNYNEAVRLINEKGQVGQELQKDLDRIKTAGIPRDIVFEQGERMIGLEKCN